MFGQKPNGSGDLMPIDIEEVVIQDILEGEDEAVECVDFDSDQPSDYFTKSTKIKLSEEPNISVESLEDTSEDPFLTTSPKRKKVREDVATNLVANAEMMSRKYEKEKRIQVADYNLGDKMTLLIPNKLRKFKTFITVNKSGGNSLTYKLLSEEGLLERRYAASVLMPFPGAVRCKEPTDDAISLSANRRIIKKKQLFFARQFYTINLLLPVVFLFCKMHDILFPLFSSLKQHRIFRFAKSGCKTNNCKCISAKIACSSCPRYNTAHCKNRDVSGNAAETPVHVSLPNLPHYGGNIVHGKEDATFLNTCSLDTWFGISKLLNIQGETFTGHLKEVCTRKH